MRVVRDFRRGRGGVRGRDRGSVGGLAVGAAAATVTALLTRDYLRARALEREVARARPLGPSGAIVGAEPELLRGSPDHVLLLVHGFGDTPQSMRAMAHALHAQGWTVALPALPGHGRSLAEFGAARAAQWIDFIHGHVSTLRHQFKHVALVGQSMGAALCTIAAASEPRLDAMVLLSPYLSMPAAVRRISRVLRVAGPLAPFRRSAYGSPSILDPEAAERALGFGVVSGRLLAELHAITVLAQDALPHVRVPTLYIASRHDNRVPAEAALRNWQRLGAPIRTLRWLERSGHIISVDVERDEVLRQTKDWLMRYTSPEPSDR